MRQFALTNKKLRGIPRRLRALEGWASTLNGYARPRSQHMERYHSWKIPVHILLVEGHQTNLEIQSRCTNIFLSAAVSLAEAQCQAYGYCRVACILNWPRLHQSEIVIFYDREYYLSFLGSANGLAPDRISRKLSLSVPPDFLEHGHDITQFDDREQIELWCIGQPP